MPGEAWDDVFQTLKENTCQPRLLFWAKLSFIIEWKIKIFHDKQKLKEFMTTKPVLQKIFKGILCTKDNDRCNHDNAGNLNLTRWVEKHMSREISNTTKQQNGRNHYIPFNNNSEC
jgi:hypothetical protein